MAQLEHMDAAHPDVITGPEWENLRIALLEVAGTPFGEPNAALDRLLERDSSALGIARVSLWLFEPGRSGIVCEALYVAGVGISRPRTRLGAESAPNYFRSLENLLTLAADDACRDPRTCEFEAGYLRPLGIGAMLDVPVRMFGEMIGILCHEHVGAARAWDERELTFACAMAALCSQTLEYARLQAAERDREQALFYDPLTGLPNRALFLDRLGQAAGHGDGALLLLDLHGFGDIVEGYGAGAGDEVLQLMAERVVAVAGRDRCGRMGNDEFAVLVASPQALVEATRLAERLRDAMAAPMVLASGRIVPQASIGVLPSIRHYDQPADALRDATVALNAAARAGRNGIEFFRQGMDEPVRRRLDFELDLRRAVAAREFEFHLQPVFTAAGHLQGAEALLRWRHPQRGLLAPVEFLGIAEDSGLLPEMHLPLLQMLFTTVAQWRSRSVPDFHIAVNIAPVQLDQPAFGAELAASLAVAGLPPQALWAEITENTLLARDGARTPVLERLAATGVVLALDDFGTGYASITHLAELPLGVVKLDRSFVVKAVADRRNAAIVHSLAGLARALDLKVVAEGVETEEQLDFLRRQGCDHMQGYLLGRPLPLAEFAARWID